MDIPSKAQLKIGAGKFITDSDLEDYFGSRVQEHIVVYGDLDDYDNEITKLLPRPRDYAIILLESKPSSGHWILLLRSGQTLEVFDSYGMFPSGELDFNLKSVNKMLDSETRWLNLMLEKALKDGFKVIYNKKRFQSLDSNVATCGKFLIFRLSMFLDKNMNLTTFIKLMDRLGKKFNLTPDELVTFLIQKHDQG